MNLKRFNVYVTARLRDTIPVDAIDGADAMLVAENVMRARLTWRPCAAFGPDGADAWFDVEPGAAEEAPDARTVTQTCAHCNTTTPKEFWGPGWMKCPRCGRRPISVGEVFGMLRLLADAVDPANPGPTFEGIAQAERAGYTTAVAAARAMLAEKGIVAP
jgi:hypothetical protein